MATPAAALLAFANPPVFQSLKWTEPGTERIVLSTLPFACRIYDAETYQRGQAGDALFNTPTLLGGQAAKAGLSCASCHRNGRDNPHFEMAGVSNGPGTADVSHSFFSAARGNGQFDPVRIPDLLASGKISRDPRTRELEGFIRNLIVDEFGGEEPSLATVDALATYVRAIKHCRNAGETVLAAKVERQIDMIDASVFGAKMMVEKQDRQGALLLIAAIRHQLGVISEYYAGPKLASKRAALSKASREVQEIGQIKDLQTMGRVLNEWEVRFSDGLARKLTAAEKNSLYNPELLAKAFSSK